MLMFIGSQMDHVVIPLTHMVDTLHLQFFLTCAEAMKKDVWWPSHTNANFLDIQTLQIACAARCQGEQDILHAEITAIVDSCYC